MLEEQQGTNFRLSDELAAKEEQILSRKQALDMRKAGPKGEICQFTTLMSGSLAGLCMLHG